MSQPTAAAPDQPGDQPGDGAPGGRTEVEPRCPRHPERISYTRCQRCGRPTCFECQVQAAVGMQCPDCVREGRDSVRAPRSVLGAPLRAGAPVTLTIVGINVVMWVLQLVVPSFTEHLYFMPVLGKSEPWRFLTAAFLHDDQLPQGLLHIGFNMWALLMTGQFLEPLLGRARFLALYLLSALGGSVAYLLLAGSLAASDPGRQWVTPTVGASGAVFGLFAATVVTQLRLGMDITSMTTLLLINFVLGFSLSNIAWQAHLGGMVTGALVAAVAAAGREVRFRSLFWPAALCLGTLLVALALWRYAADAEHVDAIAPVVRDIIYGHVVEGPQEMTPR